MNFDADQIKAFIQKNQIIVYPVIGLLILGFWSLLMMSARPSEKMVPEKEEALKKKEIGLTVSDVDHQEYINKLEKDYFEMQDRVKAIEKKIKRIGKSMQAIKNNQKNSAQQIMVKEKDIASQQAMALDVADIKPLEPPKENWVHLPIGAFCKGTLLTGVYAAADSNNPLPVLIALEEAFYGPNKTRIPLKGSFVLGKAIGDLVSERALINIVAISSVLPDGHAFEREDNLGYVTDEFGELGIHGQVIRNTGKALATSFMGGFMSGGAQALADSEVTTHRDVDGGVSRDVTGSAVKNTVFSGLAKSAGDMSQYYEKQAEDLVPAIHIRNGATVYFIVQKGVNIDGLSRADHIRISGIN